MSHRITDWDPEDVVAWEAGNKFIARRNLICRATTALSCSAGVKFAPTRRGNGRVIAWKHELNTQVI
jgi:hypothetical protein